MKSSIYRAFFLLSVSLFFAGTGYADITGMSFSPGRIGQGDGFLVHVFGGANMHIDIQVDYPGGHDTILDWLGGVDSNGQPIGGLDSNGNVVNLTAADQPLGTYTITNIRETGTTTWMDMSTSVEVVALTGLSIDPGSGYAGNTSSCKTMTFGNGEGLTVDMWFDLSVSGSDNGWGGHTLDENGQLTNLCDDHWSTPQTLTVRYIKSVSAADWVALSPPVSFTLYPPQPNSLSFSSATVNQGGSYNWTVGNGESVTLDVQVTQTPPDPNFPTGEWTGYGVVGLNSSAQATLTEPSNQLLGVYHVHDIKNSDNSEWVSVDATVKVCPSAPTVTSTSTSSGTASSTTVDVSVTIGGRGFYCGVGLTDVSGSGITGLTFDVTDPSTPATSLSTTFHIASTATTGLHTIRLSAGGGYYDFGFTVNASNAPTVTSVSPNSGMRGTSGSITITGTNLSGATPSGPSGVSWSNTSTTATSISTTYSIPCGTTPGTGNITVSNNSHTATGSFTVNNVSTPTISSISPSSSGQNSIPTVTVNGTNLCNASFSASGWSGLSFSGASSSYSSASATFTITSGATVGSPTITVTNAASLTASTSFTILNTLSWSQDYIRDGNGVVIATARPVPSDTTVPTTPSGLTVTSYTSTSVTLSWTASTDSGGSGLAGYKIYRQTGSGPNLPVGAVGDTTVTFTDVTLQSAHTYNYTVVAVDKAENYSSASGSVAQTTP